MCGIVGYIGSNNHKNIILNGLAELEYRGYDSAGFVCLTQDDFKCFKATGKLVNLKEKSKDYNLEDLAVSIGHTRWATHGKPTEDNAHPHKGEFSYLVHNGIIENYKELKEELTDVEFNSQTDSEVAVRLFEKNYQGDVKEAFIQTIKSLEGSYAILLINRYEPEKIYFAKKGSPMIVGRKDDEVFFGSSDTPLIGNADEVIYLEDGDMGCCQFGKIELFTNTSPEFKALTLTKESSQKDGFDSFMEKEMNEQASVVLETLRGRVSNNDINFTELADVDYSDIEEVRLCACGTSYHAALVGSYLIERLAKVSCKVDIASEFRYKEPFVRDNTLFVTISQSGETADTLECLKMLKDTGVQTLSICNVDNSSIVRESDAVLLLRAGVEKGVASTKAFSTQVALLWAFALHLAKQKGTLTSEKLTEEIKALANISNCLKVKKETQEHISSLAKNYLDVHGFFFIGRDVFYPLALEGALKLKEISYLHAEGYPSGEMKHGPIALADSGLVTFALCPENILFDKIKSNVEELHARNSKMCVISANKIEQADDYIQTEHHNHYMQEFFEMTVVIQLIALEVATLLGNDVDMPRNLAKSVTVE
jgi:glucosamine--fructose-6-phosphate aminotransferase (isomerizing)